MPARWRSPRLVRLTRLFSSTGSAAWLSRNRPVTCWPVATPRTNTSSKVGSSLRSSVVRPARLAAYALVWGAELDLGVQHRLRALDQRDQVVGVAQRALGQLVGVLEHAAERVRQSLEGERALVQRRAYVAQRHRTDQRVDVADELAEVGRRGGALERDRVAVVEGAAARGARGQQDVLLADRGLRRHRRTHVLRDLGVGVELHHHGGGGDRDPAPPRAPSRCARRAGRRRRAGRAPAGRRTRPSPRGDAAPRAARAAAPRARRSGPSRRSARRRSA